MSRYTAIIMLRILAGDWKKASVVVREAEQQLISQETVFRWLKLLVKRGIVEHERRSYKESYYRLKR